jgi:hypothetical protein
MFRHGLAVVALLLAVFAGFGVLPAQAAVTITFYSHEFALVARRGNTYFPHGFALLSGTTGDGTPVDANLGFTAKNIFINVLWEKITGEMDPTPLPPGYVDSANRRFSLTLSDAQYGAVLAVADKWRNWPQPSYDIDQHNCVLFVKDLAQTVGLAVSDDPKFIRDPIGFLGDVAARNATLLAQYGNPPAPAAPQPDGTAALQQRVRQLEKDAGR